jgi:excisionase family DNA binding protein
VAIETLLLRVTEVAKMLGVSRAKVYELIADGRLRSVRLDGGVAGSASTICTITSPTSMHQPDRGNQLDFRGYFSQSCSCHPKAVPLL